MFYQKWEWNHYDGKKSTMKQGSKEFGGYLPFESHLINNLHFFSHYTDHKYVTVNCGRTAFFLAAKSMEIKRIWLPVLNCADTRVPFDDLGIEVLFYKLDEQLLPKLERLENDEGILWTNYYGNASVENLHIIEKKYGGNLIVDNCHAFYAPPLQNAWNCYSARKFFGVADGGFLVYPKEYHCSEPNLPNGKSAANMNHLFEQLHLGTNAGYSASKQNEERLSVSYTQMSSLTDMLLRNIDYDKVRQIRNENILTLHSHLKDLNEFDVNIGTPVHMHYPFLHHDKNLRYQLVQDKIYTPQLWKHVLSEVSTSDIEYKLSKFMIMLPTDQRYKANDMKIISDKIKDNI